MVAHEHECRNALLALYIPLYLNVLKLFMLVLGSGHGLAREDAALEFGQLRL